jgi:YD repeat-containing protein
VTLSWTPTGSVSGLAGYLIEQCQGTGCTAFSQVMQVSSPTAQINGLTPRGIYQFRVRSLDPSGNDSGYSNIVTLTLPPIPAPSALAAAALSDSQITLTWSPASGSATTAYLVERCAGSGCTNYVQIGSTPNSPYMDGGLLTQSAYQYRVRATDAAADMSDYVSTGTSTGTLAAPGGLSGAVVSTSQINLNWFASPSTGIASYLIERCSGAGCATFTQVAAVNGTTYSDTGLTSNTSYIYRVRATDPAGAMSPYTPAVAVTTLALAPPTNLTATLIWGSQVRLAWGPSPSSCATGYVVERCNGTGCNGFLSLASVMSISYADGGAGGPGTYSYRVHATDAAGDVSVASNVVSVTTSSGSGTGGSGSGTGGSGGGSGGGSSGGGTGPGGGGSNSGSTSTYVYDSNGHLIKVTTNGVTTTYTYDAAGHVVSIQNGN